MRRVGIMGGMGPLATIDLFKKIVELTKAKSDQENIPLLIDNYPQIPDRTAFILGGDKDPLPQLIESAKRLKNGGCEALCIACNTAHYFADAIEKEVGIEILRINTIAVEAIKRDFKGVKNIAVVGTTATKKAKIYDLVLSANGFNSVEFKKEAQDRIMSAIYDGVKAGRVEWAANRLESALDEVKADLFIAGCTEIPVMLPYLKKERLFLDATNELAKAVVKYSLDD